jgi:hypothetical protein
MLALQCHFLPQDRRLSALSFSLDVHPLRLQGDATGDDFTFMATAGFATNPICVADRVLEWLPSGILIQPN